MDLKKIFNSFLTHGFSVRIGILNGSGQNGKDEWNNKISQEDASQNEISGGWVTSRIFYNGEKSTDHSVIYTYLHDKLGMGNGVDPENPNFEKFYFLLQTATLVKNNPDCKVEKLAQIAYNVGQMLACIDFYAEYPLALQYIVTNKLNKIESYINLPTNTQTNSPQLAGGFDENPVLNMYRKYIDMTPYKGAKLVGGTCQSSQCSCGSDGCKECNGKSYLDLLI